MKIEKNITPHVEGFRNFKDSKPAFVTPAKFNSVTLTFTSETEYGDVIAALAAFGRKSIKVEGTSIAEDYGLKCSKDVRKTINHLLHRLP
jgi:hypothetical protein